MIDSILLAKAELAILSKRAAEVVEGPPNFEDVLANHAGAPSNVGYDSPRMSPGLLAALTASSGFSGLTTGGLLGAGIGGLVGRGRGNTPEGIGRGLVRGGMTGAGLGAGSFLGQALAQGAGVNGVVPGLAGAGLGAAAGWIGSGRLLRPIKSKEHVS